MASPFDIFARPTFALRRVSSPTSGHFNPTTDIWEGPDLGTGPVTIQGHLSIVNIMGRESQWGNTPEGVIEKGTLRFFTETELQEGDILEADQEDGIVFQYRVNGLVRANRFIANQLGTPVRFEYNVVEVPR